MDGSFPIALNVTIRLCRREDLDDLEWFGQWREHRPLLEQAFAAQGRGEQAFTVAEANGFPVGQVWVDLAKLRAESIGWIMRKNLSNRKENEPCSGSN